MTAKLRNKICPAWLTLGVGLTVAQSFLQADVIYYNDFENGFGGHAFTWECRPSQFNLTTLVARAGHQAIKQSNGGGEQCREPNGKVTARTEMVWRTETSQMLLPVGDWGWFGWSVYIPSDFPPPEPDGKGFYMMQTGGGGEHGWRMLIKNEKFDLQRTYSDPSGNRLIDDGVWTASIVRGRWHDFVIRQFLSTGADGRVSLWHNGVLVVDDLHGANYGGNGSAVRVKTGIYWGLGTRTHDYTLYFDELRIGDANSSYDEMKPREKRPRGPVPVSGPAP